MNKILLGILMLLMLLFVLGVALATPLEIGIKDIDYIKIGDNLSINPYVYDETGLLIEANCNYKLNNIIIGNNTLMNITGEFTLDVWCNTSTTGGYYTDDFIVTEETSLGLWTPVTDWTFPIIYLVITIIIILLGLIYTSSIVGVFGSVMLILSYFMIGATSPLLLAPLLIIGLLLTFKFASI